MDVTDYGRIVWQRRWVIAGLVAVLAAGAIAASSRRAPEYVAQASVFVGPRALDPGDAPAVVSELFFSREFVTSYAEVLKRTPLAERVLDRLGVARSPQWLTQRIATHVLPETRIIEVSVRDGDPTRAQRLANALVHIFVEDTRRSFPSVPSPAVVLEQAQTPAVPASPHPLRDGAMAGVLGLILGLGVAIFLENRDTTLREREEVEELLAPLPLLGVIPLMQVSPGSPAIAVHGRGKTPSGEAFRVLRTNIQFVAVERAVGTLLITSPSAQDGKTTIALNLAATLALAGFDTVLVEGDLRRPSLAAVLGVRRLPGLADVLIGRARLAEAVQPTSVPLLTVLPAGTIPPNPSELLGSRAMWDLLDELKQSHRILVVDSPPALAVADAGVLAGFADGVVLVVRAGRTARNHARAAVAALQRLGGHTVGAVFNGANVGNPYYDYYRLHDHKPDVVSGPSVARDGIARSRRGRRRRQDDRDAIGSGADAGVSPRPHGTPGNLDRASAVAVPPEDDGRSRMPFTRTAHGHGNDGPEGLGGLTRTTQESPGDAEKAREAGARVKRTSSPPETEGR